MVKLIEAEVSEAKILATFLKVSQDTIDHPVDIAILSLENLAPQILESGDDEAIIAYKKLKEYFDNIKQETVTKPNLIMIEADTSILEHRDLPHDLQHTMPQPACRHQCCMFQRWIGSKDYDKPPCFDCSKYEENS